MGEQYQAMETEARTVSGWIALLFVLALVAFGGFFVSASLTPRAPAAMCVGLGLVASGVLCLRGFRAAILAEDGFSKLLAVGFTFGLALQAFIIVGGVLRVIPLTGITLPFVSYGGSSVVANFVMLAGLLLVSNRAEARAR